MPSRKTVISTFVASSCIISGLYILTALLNCIKCIALEIDSKDAVVAISVIFIAAFATSHKSVQKTFSDFTLRKYYTHREFGISTVISAAFFTVKSFYLSFYDFENSLMSLYTAFVLALISVFAMYGRTGVPSTTVVITAGHASLVLAFFGLAMMITPHNMINPAFVVAFTATFALVISVVLFILSTTRPYEIVDGIFCDQPKVVPSAEVLEHLQEETEAADEVFADVEEIAYQKEGQQVGFVSKQSPEPSCKGEISSNRQKPDSAVRYKEILREIQFNFDDLNNRLLAVLDDVDCMISMYGITLKKK